MLCYFWFAFAALLLRLLKGTASCRQHVWLACLGVKVVYPDRHYHHGCLDDRRKRTTGCMCRQVFGCRMAILTAILGQAGMHVYTRICRRRCNASLVTATEQQTNGGK
jgi:hypothetical protein